jgi:hypothetical protein
MLWKAKEARLCGVRVSRPGCRERHAVYGMQGVRGSNPLSSITRAPAFFQVDWLVT